MKRMYWLLGVMSVICLAWFARADFVRLQDGKVLEGTITEEDAISVTIQVERPDVAVREKRWVLKSDTTEIHRATTEEKAARDMELAFATLQKLQIDPTNSFRLDYYDQTLTNVFRKFLADYPDSPHTKEVTSKIAEWEAERALVASGKVKAQGQWLTAKEVAAGAAREAVQQAHQRGIILLSQNRFGEAVEQFEFVIANSHDAALIQQARQLRIDAYQKWVPLLEQQRRRLADDINRLEKRVTDARAAKAGADAKFNASSDGGGDIRARARSLGAPRDVSGGSDVDNGVTRLGANTDSAQSFTAAARARLELQTAEAALAAARMEAMATEKTLTRIQPQATALGITIAANNEVVATQVVAVTAHPVASTESPDTLTGIAQFAQKYWVYFLVVAVIMIWIFTRALGR